MFIMLKYSTLLETPYIKFILDRCVLVIRAFRGFSTGIYQLIGV